MILLNKTYNNIKLSNVSKKDIDQILKIENECFKYDAFSKKQFLYALKSKNAIFIKAEIEDFLVGYLLSYIKNFTINNNLVKLAHLYSIAVLKKMQGRSIGKILLLEFEKILKMINCNKIFLEVNVNNNNAIKLYENLGYKKIGTVLNYYNDGSAAFKYVKNI